MRTIEYIDCRVLSLNFVIAKEQGNLAFIGSECAGVDELNKWFNGDNVKIVEGSPEYFMDTIEHLERYYRGEDVYFDESMVLKGSEIQMKVWDYIKHIPYGTTQTYRDVAYALGYPKAVRAIASAVGKNPVLIAIPCHRVIGSNGQLRGYRGGLAMKHRLLEMEKQHRLIWNV